jgi:hypothetical protein
MKEKLWKKPQISKNILNKEYPLSMLYIGVYLAL